MYDLCAKFTFFVPIFENSAGTAGYRYDIRTYPTSIMRFCVNEGARLLLITRTGTGLRARKNLRSVVFLSRVSLDLISLDTALVVLQFRHS